MESPDVSNPAISAEDAMRLILESTDVDITDGDELKQMLVAQVMKTNELREVLRGKIESMNEMAKELDSTRKSLTAELVENLMFKSDSVYAVYFALNRKANEAAGSLNEFQLVLTKDKNDKTFERFKQLTSMLPDLMKTINSLRNDYMRLGEEEAKEAESKGVPLIEQKRDKAKVREQRKPTEPRRVITDIAPQKAGQSSYEL
jgi:ElaB/YqjD/DUF883 family membrane-anchored ribosome-binding protein